jgi:hypothetical protein
MGWFYCLFVFPTLWGFGFYAIQQVAQAGWSPVLFRCRHNCFFLPCVRYIYIFFILCGLHFNHLFIWLDPEVVAHDALIATKVGYLNFGLLEQYSFWVDGIYIDITRQKNLAQDEANDDSFTKKNFNISAVFWFSL